MKQWWGWSEKENLRDWFAICNAKKYETGDKIKSF